MLVLWLGLGLWLVSGSSLVGVCRHLAAVVWSTYSGSVEYTRRSCPEYAGTTVVSVTLQPFGRGFRQGFWFRSPLPGWRSGIQVPAGDILQIILQWVTLYFRLNQVLN